MLILCISHENVRSLSQVSIHSPHTVRAAAASSPCTHGCLPAAASAWDRQSLLCLLSSCCSEKRLICALESRMESIWDAAMISHVSPSFGRETTSCKFPADFPEICSNSTDKTRDYIFKCRLPISKCVPSNSFTDAALCLLSLFSARNAQFVLLE